MAQTLYWHDYETFGLDPARDRPAQFAGLRTDLNLNPVGEPLVLYCKPPQDYLPQPEACMVTGISPQLASQKGVCEAEFIKTIHNQLLQPETCTLGYNTLRFDDEVTRNTLYRNFFDPYVREWKNGNSRWDLIDLARGTRSLRPEGINWPNYDDGTPNFRLEFLTAANGLEHASAHDALSDVEATVAFARLLKKVQPKLYDFVFKHRSKNKVLSLLKLGSMQPLLHVSGMYPSTKGNIAVIIPLCKHPTNNNGVLVYDLSIDPSPVLSLSAQQIHERIFTAADDLQTGVQRIPLKTVHINKCPFLAPLSVLKAEDSERLNIDLDTCQQHLTEIKTHTNLASTLSQVFSQHVYENYDDPDLMIYSGGFFKDADRSIMDKITKTQAKELASLNPAFADSRLKEMLFRYRARNYPQTLNEQESETWRSYCLNKLTLPNKTKILTYPDFMDKLEALKTSSEKQQMIVELESYASQLIANLQ